MEKSNTILWILVISSLITAYYYGNQIDKLETMYIDVQAQIIALDVTCEKKEFKESGIDIDLSSRFTDY